MKYKKKIFKLHITNSIKLMVLLFFTLGNKRIYNMTSFDPIFHLINLKKQIIANITKYCMLQFCDRMSMQPYEMWCVKRKINHGIVKGYILLVSTSDENMKLKDVPKWGLYFLVKMPYVKVKSLMNFLDI